VRRSEVEKAEKSLEKARESLKKAHERLEKAHERLKEEREYHLMLMQTADRKRRKDAMEGSWE
jgi:cellobiose-specific phosphotransferase system component IIA